MAQGGGVPSGSVFAVGLSSCSLRLPEFIYLGSKPGGGEVKGL